MCVDQDKLLLQVEASYPRFVAQLYAERDQCPFSS